MFRYDFINYLVKKHNYQSYLEIGVDYGDCISKINIETKHGVDPVQRSEFVTHNMTSDEFFRTEEQKNYDVVFIDGLHLHEQVIMDVDNSLKVLNKGGIILLHDCSPMKEEYQRRKSSNGPWTGDVWKAILHYRKTRSDLHVSVIDSDYGVGLIKRGKQTLFEDRTKYASVAEYPYDFLVNNRKELLNLITTDEFYLTY